MARRSRHQPEQLSRPEWLDRTPARLRHALESDRGGEVIGQIDWEAHNLDWRDHEPVLVNDWDSLAIRTEAAIAGAAAAVYPSTGPVVAATIDQTAAFLDAYRQHRPAWTARDDEVTWAAGLWVLIYNAKKEALGGGAGYLAHLDHELDERVRLARL